MLTFSKTEHYHFDPSIVLELTTTFVCSFDGTILYWSEGCAHLYGWTASEVVGRNAHDMLSTVLPIQLRELERELRCNGEWIGDVRQVKRCGSPVTTCIKTTLVSDTEGESSAFVHVVTDVTASRELEAQLRKSEATLSAVIDSLPVGLVIADPDGRVLRDNAANRKIWGVPPQTTSWEQYGEWEGYWPNTGKRIAPDEWAMSRALFKREIVRGELVECQPFNNGPRRFYLNNAAPVLDANGHIIAGVVAELDVTEQRQAQMALTKIYEESQAAAERVQLALAAGAIAGTWDWDLISDRFAVDETFAEYFGIDVELGRSGLSLEQVIATVHPEDLSELHAAIAKAIRCGGPYSHEYRVRGRDGIYRWIQANGRVDHSESGLPLRFPGVLLDIEQRRAVEIERDRAMHLLRSFIEAVPGVVYAKDYNGRMTVGNQGVSELVGKPLEMILGKTDVEFLENSEQATVIMATDRRIMDSGRAEVVEEEVSFPDGRRTMWLSTKAPLYNESSEVIGLIGSSVNITERKAAEEALQQRTEELCSTQLRLEMALAASRMGVWEWSVATGEATWSRQMFELLGLPPALDGKSNIASFMAKVHPEDTAIVERSLARCLSEGTDYEAEMRIVLDDGNARWLLGRGRVSYGRDGKAERVTGVNVDITERKESEHVLHDADRRRNEFLAMLGHELRNPLAPIANVVALLELTGEDKEKRTHSVQIIRRQAKHMARLVDDLLEVSRVVHGQIELRKEKVVLSSAIYPALESVFPLAKERGQTIKHSLPPDIELVADPARIIQIVTNVLQNAVKYTQVGGCINVESRISTNDDQWVEISVADNGPGIDPGLLPCIFDLFSQATATLDRSRGGLGLGLSLVKRLVELHGGEVLARNRDFGRGACFSVRLPRGAQDRNNVDTLDSTSKRLAPTKFLIVDDNVDGLNTLGMLLEADGHSVARAYDGEAAITAALQFHPSVVLLDLGLPKLNGWEVAQLLRSTSTTNNAVLIALSGYGQPGDRDRSHAAGFNDHLLKPVNLEALYFAIMPHIRHEQDPT